MVLSWKNFPIKKYRGEGFLAKNAVFCYFSCPLRKKFQVAANRTILILEVMIWLFPARCWAGWFSNQNEQRALVSNGPLRTHVTTLCVEICISLKKCIWKEGNIWITISLCTGNFKNMRYIFLLTFTIWIISGFSRE